MCRYKDGLVGTLTAAHYLLHRQRQSIHNLVGTSNAAHYLLHRRRRSIRNLVGTSTAALTSYIDEGEASFIANREDVSETGGGSYKALLVVAVSFGLI